MNLNLNFEIIKHQDIFRKPTSLKMAAMFGKNIYLNRYFQFAVLFGIFSRFGGVAGKGSGR